jgi:hypothetical protein
MNRQTRIKFISIGLFLRNLTGILLTTLLLPGLARAQAKFTAIASSKEIGRNDYVQIKYLVENARQIDYLTEPSFRDFRIIQGPVESSGMSIVNGIVSQNKSLLFVLQPLKTGKFIIPAARALVDGKQMHSNSLIIAVTPGGSGNTNPLLAPQPAWPEAGQPDMDYILRPGENINEKIRKNLFIKVQVSKTTCFVGEPIVATYKLYSHLECESRVSKHPSLNGFSVYDMVDPNSLASTEETVNGKAFTVHVIRKAQLIPLLAGQIDLDPLEIENTVHFVKSSKPAARGHNNGTTRDLFDSFFEEQQQGVPVQQEVNLESKPVTIHVKALPEENKPLDYNGAVGHFSIQSGLKTTSLTEQDAGIFKITVKGVGNLPVVNAPVVAWPAGIESYDPSAKEDIDKAVAPLSGTKSFEYSFIPKKPGNYLIPAVFFSYFDPVSASYKMVKSGPVSFQAAAIKKKTGGSPAAIIARTATQPRSLIPQFFQDHLEWFFAVLILAGLAFYLYLQNRKLRKAGTGQPALEQSGGARTEPESPPAPVDLLQQAKDYLSQGQYREFYREINRVLWAAAEDKLDLPGSEMNKHTIARKLSEAGWERETTSLLEAVWQECELRLYTPSHNVSDLERVLGNAEEILSKLKNG